MALLLALLACSDPAPEAPVLSQDAADHAIRASLAVRGTRPSVEELTAVARDPSALEPLVRSWLDDPAFATTVRDQHAFHLGLRTSNIGKLPPLGPLAGNDLGAIATSLDEAPLHLIADVVTSGRPFGEVLTTADTMADPITAAAHGLAHDPRGPEWQRTPWADGRPAAGVLADTAFNQRYMSSNTNFHRARAAAAMATFLCRDLLDAATPTLFDPVGAEDAVREDPACLGCHQSLDPVASAFWGLHPYITSGDVLDAYRGGCQPGAPCLPLRFWDDEATAGWVEHDLPHPGWAGNEVAGLAGLARAFTEDPDFDRCTARRFHAWHTGRDLRDVPAELVTELTATLQAHDGDVRELVVASVLSDDLREAPQRLLRPEELARTVEALTGFRWEGDPDVSGCEAGCYGLVDLAQSDAHGFRALLGGVDGWDVREPANGPSPTHALALDWLAEESARHVVLTDAMLPAPERRLLRYVEPGAVSSPEAVERQLRHLHAAILGELVDPDLARSEQLYRAVEASEGPAAAWEAVISAMLRDHRVVLP